MTEGETEILKIVRTHLVTSESRLFDHITTTFRWVMGTLFAANGGAIVALMGSSDARVKDNEAALAWFATGLLLSIVMGMLSAFASYRASVRLTVAKLQVDKALIEGELRHDIMADLNAEKPTWKTWIPSYVGVASLLCLFAGMVSSDGRSSLRGAHAKRTRAKRPLPDRRSRRGRLRLGVLD